MFALDSIYTVHLKKNLFSQRLTTLILLVTLLLLPNASDFYRKVCGFIFDLIQLPLLRRFL